MSPNEARALTLLPSRPAPHPGQALDCYLEHVADANYLSAGTLMRAITAAADTTRYLLLRPTPRTLQVLSELTGHSPETLTAATLTPLDGTLVDLTGLDPSDLASFRAVAARGWAPGQGTAICPRCLAENGMWEIAWRLPTSTVCLLHHTYLLATCPTCRKPFRATRSTPLRPVGAATRCGNALGSRGRYCPQDLTTLPTARADPGCIVRQRATDPQSLTITAAPPVVFGAPSTTREFVADVKSLTALLLHIATATDRGEMLPTWAVHVQVATAALSRAPRWGLRPPADIPTRSRALTTAAEILTSPDLETALTSLAPWIEAVPPAPEGFLSWTGDHMRATATTTRLVMAAHAPRRRTSRLLDAALLLTTSTRAIPQLIPKELYEAHLAGLFTSRPQTIRLFAALAIARTHPAITTWADAAHALGLPESLGPRCAAAAATSQTASPTRVIAGIHAVASDLEHRDYRDLENRVRLLAEPGPWFTSWARQHRPGTHASTQDLAVQWLWTHGAHAHPATAPEPDKARARRFAATLTPTQQHRLRQVLDDAGDAMTTAVREGTGHRRCG